MRASQEARWKQQIKENEDRRRRYEETSRKLEQEDKEQARRALEERRAERARMDDLMRHPSQAPAPPKKPILRKGSGAVLRSPPRGTAAAGAGGSFGAPRPSTVPARSSGSPAGGRSPGRSPVRAVTACADGQRREWSEGLKHFIAGQREAGRPYGLATQAAPLAAPDDALSWQELKLAAEAGFEELLRAKEAAAAAGQQGGSPSWRRPGMTRATGGGGSTAIEQWEGPAGCEQDLPAQGDADAVGPWQGPESHTTGAPAGLAEPNTCSSSAPVSKWAARMQQTRGAAAAAAASDVQSAAESSAEHAALQEACTHQEQLDRVQDMQQQDQQLQGVVAAGVLTQQPVVACLQQSFHQEQQPQGVQVEAAVQGTAQQQQGQVHMQGIEPRTVPPEQQQVVPGSTDVAEGQHYSNSSTPRSPEAHPPGWGPSSALHDSADGRQHLTAPAAQAAAALRASMEQLHRSAQALPRARSSPPPPAAAASAEDERLADDTGVAATAALGRGPADACVAVSQCSQSGGPVGTHNRRYSRCSSLDGSNSGSSAGSDPASPEPAPCGGDAEAAEETCQPGVEADTAAADTQQQHCPMASLGHIEQPSTEDRRGTCLQQQQHRLVEVEQEEGDEQQQVQTSTSIASMAVETCLQQSLVAQQRERVALLVQQHLRRNALLQQQLLPPTPSEQPEQPQDAVSWQAGGVRQAMQAVNAAPVDAADVPAQPKLCGHISPTAQPAASVAGPGTTLDSLLAEARHLAALRKAVGAEFAAMGRSRVAAVMGADVDAGVCSSSCHGNDKPPPCCEATDSPAEKQQGAQHNSALSRQQQQQPVCAPPLTQPPALAEPDQPLKSVVSSSNNCSSPASTQQSALLESSERSLKVRHTHTGLQCLAPDTVQPPCQPQSTTLHPASQDSAQHQRQQQELPNSLQQQTQHQQQSQSQQLLPRYEQQQRYVPEQEQHEVRHLACLARPPAAPNSGEVFLAANPLYQPPPPHSPGQPQSGGGISMQQPSAAADNLMVQPQPTLHMQQETAQWQEQQDKPPQPLLQQQQQQQQQHEQPSGSWQQPQQQPGPHQLGQQPAGALPGSHQQDVQQPPARTQRARVQEPSWPQSHAGQQGGVVQHSGYWPWGSSTHACAPTPGGVPAGQAPWGVDAGYNSGAAADTQPWQQLQHQQWQHQQWQQQEQGQEQAIEQQFQQQWQQQQQGKHATEQLQSGAAADRTCYQDMGQMQGPPHFVQGTCSGAEAAVSPADVSAEGAVGDSNAAAAAAPNGGGGSSSNHFLSKLASKARTAVKSAVGRMAVGSQPQQQGPLSSPAALRELPPRSPRLPPIQPADAGSYVAAAVVAQQRAEAEAADRLRIEATSQASKQAAARKLAADRAEVQRRKMAEHGPQNNKPAPVDIGSYAQQQQQQQQQQAKPTARQLGQQLQQQQHRQTEQEQVHDSCVCDTHQQSDSHQPAVQQAYNAAARTATPASPTKFVQQQPQASLQQHTSSQPRAPQVPPPDRSCSPRRKAVRPGAAAAGAAAAVTTAAAQRAADQCVAVSRIPPAPGAKPVTPPSPAVLGRADAGTIRRQSQQQQQQQQQQQSQDPGATAQHAADSDDDNDFAFLERELQSDTYSHVAAAAAKQADAPAHTTGTGYWGQHQPHPQHQQPQPLLHQYHHQQPQARVRLHTPPCVSPMQVACGPDGNAATAAAASPPGQHSMWAAVHAATAAAAKSPGRVAMQPDTASADRFQQMCNAQAGTATRRDAPGPAAPAASCSSAKPGAKTSSAPAAKTSQQASSNRRAPPQPQQPSQPSRLSLEEADLLAELQQLDQRMQQQPSTGPDTHRDAAPSTAKLPALAPPAARWGGGRSPGKMRGTTAGASSNNRPAAKSPLRSAPPTTAPQQRGFGSGCPKLAAVHGATAGSRGASAGSTSSCDVGPASARAQQQQQQLKASKQAKLVNVTRPAAHNGSASIPSSAAKPPASPLMTPHAACANPHQMLPPWARLVTPGGGAPSGPAPPGAQGMLAPWGGVMDPQGQQQYTYQGQTAGGMMGQPHLGLVWPEGPQAAAAAWQQGHQGAAPAGAWQQQQQQQHMMWWPPHNMQQQYQHAGAPASGGMWPAPGSPPPGYPFAYPTGAANRHQYQHQQQYYNAPAGSCLPQGPPSTALPSGLLGPAPGSPLLPTLHYQQTIMRHRASTSGSDAGGGGGGGGSNGHHNGMAMLMPGGNMHWQQQQHHPGAQHPDGIHNSGSAGGSRWGSAGGSSLGSRDGLQQARPGVSASGCAASGWGSQVSREAANVWPPRGVERSILGGAASKGAGGARGDGDIVVYNAHLLL